MSDKEPIVTNVLVHPNEAYGKRFYEISFYNMLAAKPEPLLLVVHEVELKRLATSLGKLLAGEQDAAGSEGIYVYYNGPPSGHKPTTSYPVNAPPSGTSTSAQLSTSGRTPPASRSTTMLVSVPGVRQDKAGGGGRDDLVEIGDGRDRG